MGVFLLRSSLRPLLGLLFQKGWIEDPVGKSKSVVFTEAGERLASELLMRHFARESLDRGRVQSGT